MGTAFVVISEWLRRMAKKPVFEYDLIRMLIVSDVGMSGSSALVCFALYLT
jgi:hypothetical protein